MKIRHKLSGVVLEGSFTDVADCSNLPPFKFYELADGSRFSKASWEEVKPVWKDVTMECSSLPHLASLRHEGDVIAELKSGYRLRKVCPDSQYPAECFIIEQRQA